MYDRDGFQRGGDGERSQSGAAVRARRSLEIERQRLLPRRPARRPAVLPLPGAGKISAVSRAAPRELRTVDTAGCCHRRYD